MIISPVSRGRTLYVKRPTQMLFLSSFRQTNAWQELPQQWKWYVWTEGENSKFEGMFAKLCRRHNIRQEFTTAGSLKFNGVSKRHIAMVESAGMATQVQAK